VRLVLELLDDVGQDAALEAVEEFRRLLHEHHQQLGAVVAAVVVLVCAVLVDELE